MTAFFTAPAIAWGPGAIEQLSGVGARRAIVLVDRAVAGTPPARRVVEELEKAGTTVDVVAAESAPDRTDAIETLRSRASSARPDWIVVVGGGRTLDAGKALRLALEAPELSLASPPPVLPFPETPTVRLVAIPTTSGSGAEASWVADVTAPDGTPLELSDRRLVPEWALVDPEFAAARSGPGVVAEAVEAAAVAIEAYLSAWANPFSDALALDAAVTVLRRLPNAVRWSADPDARAAIHYAATAAGLAASNAQRGIGHALARALVEPTGRPYAELLGVLLPYVLDFDRPAARDRLERLAASVGPPDDRTTVALPLRLRRLYDTVRFPVHLGSTGADLDPLRTARATVVARTLRSPAALANPRVPAAADVEGILDAAIAGRPGAG